MKVAEGQRPNQLSLCAKILVNRKQIPLDMFRFFWPAFISQEDLIRKVSDYKKEAARLERRVA